MKTLEAAKASEHFTKLLNEVHALGTSFKILKQGVPFGCLVPATERGCNSHELADDLEGAELSAADRRAMSLAVRQGRKALKPLKNPWG